MNTDELLENLLYSALFPRMDSWRRYESSSIPPDPWLRVFLHVETRLQRRYGVIELERLVATATRRRLFAAQVINAQAMLTRVFAGLSSLAN